MSPGGTPGRPTSPGTQAHPVGTLTSHSVHGSCETWPRGTGCSRGARRGSWKTQDSTEPAGGGRGGCRPQTRAGPGRLPLSCCPTVSFLVAKEGIRDHVWFMGIISDLTFSRALVFPPVERKEGHFWRKSDFRSVLPGAPRELGPVLGGRVQPGGGRTGQHVPLGPSPANSPFDPGTLSTPLAHT